MKRYVCVAVLMVALGAAGANAEPAAEATNAFAVDLYKQLSAGEGNLFFSPLSVASALAMAYEGASGATAEEMAKVLHLDAEEDAGFGALVKGMTSEGAAEQPCRLYVANAAWLDKRESFLEPYTETVERDFAAELFRVDFGKAERSRERINGWVKEKTFDKIDALVAPGQIGPDTRLVLTNAIYFRGDWKHPFAQGETKDGEFHVSRDKAVRVEMMNHGVDLPLFMGDGYRVASVPYVGGRFAMLIALPDAVDGLKALEESLTPGRIAEWIAGVRERNVFFVLPKFRTGSQLNLADVLAKMGMERAFGPGADFSRMTKSSGLFISHVVHKTYVDVNEEGTEAAAATGLMALGVKLPDPRDVRVDHPFWYAIYDRATGTVLFAGRMVDPTAES